MDGCRLPVAVVAADLDLRAVSEQFVDPAVGSHLIHRRSILNELVDRFPKDGVVEPRV